MMPVKFKIGFTIDAETLFGIVAKFLPLENLAVEEVVERPERHVAPRLAHSKSADTPKIRSRRASNVNSGQLKVLIDCARKHGVASHADFGEALKAAGFSRLGAGSALKRALDKGVLRKHESGGYTLP